MPEHRTPWWRKVSLTGALATGALVIGLASSAIWFWRDVRSTFAEEAPEKGSLIVNINTGTSEELQTIPDIGPVRAERIISYRQREPFKSVDDLHKVTGIPRVVVDGMIPYVTVLGETHKKPSTSN